MLYKLYRGPSSDKGTFGIFCADNVPLVIICEDPWNDNRREISCIPAGTYKFKKRCSERHGHHWQILGVPDRDLILIHAGNTIDHTKGCLLAGRSFSHLGDLPSVMQSQEAMAMLRETLPDEGVIEIINPN